MKTVGQLVKEIKECNFYCLKKEKVFRFTNKKTKAVIKFPIDISFYGEKTNVICGGMGWWRDKYFKTEINCSDGKLIVENQHSRPTEYKITIKIEGI